MVQGKQPDEQLGVGQVRGPAVGGKDGSVGQRGTATAGGAGHGVAVFLLAFAQGAQPRDRGPGERVGADGEHRRAGRMKPAPPERKGPGLQDSMHEVVIARHRQEGVVRNDRAF